jgi:hypothetical protein
MRTMKIGACLGAVLLLLLDNGCTMLSVAGTAVSVAGSAVSVGVSAGTTVVKGAANVVGAVVE